MNFNNKTLESETHPLLPSGEWEGFYCYHHSPSQHKMAIELNFANALVTGSGTDDVAAFTWKGKYDLANFKINMTKYYSKHEVGYNGDIDENGIWGTWEIIEDFANIPPQMVSMIKEAFRNQMTGGFHIWPKKNNVNKNTAEEETESAILKEIFSKEFAKVKQ